MVEKMFRFCYMDEFNDDRLIRSQQLSNTGYVSNTSTTAITIIPEGAEHSHDEGIGNLQFCFLVTNSKLYILGDKHDNPRLKEVAVRKYTEVVTELWNSFVFADSARLIRDNTVGRNDILRDVT